MSRSSIAIVAVLAFAPLAAAAQSPAPAAGGSPKGTQHAAGLSSKVLVPRGTVGSVSSSACNARAVGVNDSQGALGPNSATESRTLVVVPLGGNSVSSATAQQQISEACTR